MHWSKEIKVRKVVWKMVEEYMTPPSVMGVNNVDDFSENRKAQISETTNCIVDLLPELVDLGIKNDI